MRLKNGIVAAVGIALLGSTPNVACAMAPATPARSAQTIFNEAQAAFDRADWQAAIAGYRSALATQANPGRSAAVIRARLAAALQNAGRLDEAETEANAAIAIFLSRNITQDEELALTYNLLGYVHRSQVKTQSAVADYQRALATATGSNKPAISAASRLGLAIAALTTDPDLAATTMDTLVADQKFFDTLDKPAKARVYSIDGLAELNRGHLKAAADLVERALDISGRTSTRVNIAQIQTRGDAALIYARLGNQEKVRQYLTFSGAGHLPDDGWLTNAENNNPVCDSDVGPQDFAVVEFAIGDDGRAVGAAPIYANRPGVVGTTFAAAVRKWHWNPVVLAKLDQFWRSSVRIELRCLKRPPPIKLVDAFRESTAMWLMMTGFPAELADPAFHSGTAPTGRVPAAFAALSQASTDRTAAAAGDELGLALASANAPPDVRAFAAYLAAEPKDKRGGAYWSAFAANLAKAIPAVGQQHGSERASAWLRTELGLALEAGHALGPARQQLQSVVTLPLDVLPEADPIRTLAMLHISTLDKRSRNPESADAGAATKGVDPEQCSLLDVRPVARNNAIGSSAFPAEALRWGFEGDVREAFDIAPDGSVRDVRTVLAYPPFVFGPATEQAVSHFHYLLPSIGDQPIGCTGQAANVKYIQRR